jgi:hypothetical protein
VAQRYATGKAQRDYLLRWQRVGRLVDAARYDALRRMTRREYLEIMDRLFSVPVRPTRRLSSGLVEWHRLFNR